MTAGMAAVLVALSDQAREARDEARWTPPKCPSCDAPARLDALGLPMSDGAKHVYACDCPVIERPPASQEEP